MTTQRLDPKDRKRRILSAALSLAARNGYNRITRDAIAQAADCAPGLVSNYFGTMTALRRDIMRAAIREQELAVVAQGIVAKDPHALKASPELKQQALLHYATK